MRTRPTHLPFCAYPTAAEVDQHGIQPLPETLPVTDLTCGDAYRSRQRRITPAADLSDTQLVELTEVLGDSFAQRDVMCRHLRPGHPPAGLEHAIHRDPLGSGEFGPWTTARLMTWFIRLLALTDPTSPRAFADALAAGRVGHHFMIGRGDALPRDDAFELTAATMERFRDTGFSYVIVEAAKQWTGAACEALGGVRVHFAPYRTQPVVPTSGEGITSPDGFLSDKDSGCLLYLHRLAG